MICTIFTYLLIAFAIVFIIIALSTSWEAHLDDAYFFALIFYFAAIAMGFFLFACVIKVLPAEQAEAILSMLPKT